MIADLRSGRATDGANRAALASYVRDLRGELLKHGLDRQPLLADATDARPVLTHDNVRGPAYYLEGEPS